MRNAYKTRPTRARNSLLTGANILAHVLPTRVRVIQVPTKDTRYRQSDGRAGAVPASVAPGARPGAFQKHNDPLRALFAAQAVRFDGEPVLEHAEMLREQLQRTHFCRLRDIFLPCNGH